MDRNATSTSRVQRCWTRKVDDTQTRRATSTAWRSKAGAGVAVAADDQVRLGWFAVSSVAHFSSPSNLAMRLRRMWQAERSRDYGCHCEHAANDVRHCSTRWRILLRTSVVRSCTVLID